MIELRISFNSDEKGYFDRECPKCKYIFKILMSDWEEKVSDLEVHCPMCGHVDTSDKWFTQKHIDDMESKLSNYMESFIQKQINKNLKNLANSTYNNKFIKIIYEPGSPITFVNNPIEQSEEWEQEIKCPKCQTSYSVIGLAYFCPCCGYYVIENEFDKTLDIIEKKINSLPNVEPLMIQLYDKDTAAAFCRATLDNSLGDIVSIFQKFAEMKYKSISSNKVRVNDFQNVEKGSKLFQEAAFKGYDTWLSRDEISYMNLMIQKRHILEHNGGIVDKTYIEKSNDTNYSIGQRIIICEDNIYKFIFIIKKLGNGLKGITT